MSLSDIARKYGIDFCILYAYLCMNMSLKSIADYIKANGISPQYDTMAEVGKYIRSRGFETAKVQSGWNQGGKSKGICRGMSPEQFTVFLRDYKQAYGTSFDKVNEFIAQRNTPPRQAPQRRRQSPKPSGRPVDIDRGYSDKDIEEPTENDDKSADSFDISSIFDGIISTVVVIILIIICVFIFRSCTGCGKSSNIEVFTPNNKTVTEIEITNPS
jgi:hypothetical protein